ncbi:MAG: hypothetical protein ACOC9Y_07130 [Chloroflexota bacterium]
MVDTVIETYAEAPPARRESELSVLAERLDRGWQLIEERRSAGEAIQEYEDHWLRLLKEYEAAYRSLHD